MTSEWRKLSIRFTWSLAVGTYRWWREGCDSELLVSGDGQVGFVGRNGVLVSLKGPGGDR